MVPQIYLPIETENIIILCQRIYFCISSFFNAIATICLFKETPDMQSDIKFYLYYIQVLVFLCDLILDVAIEPFTLFPICGGYCKGPVCGWLSIRYSMLLTFLIICNIGFCKIACLLCRHQALVTGAFKFEKVTHQAIQLGLFIFVCVPTIFGLITPFDDSESDALIELHVVSWIRDRGPHVIYRRTTNIVLIIPLLLIAVTLFICIGGIALTAHTIWHIRHGAKRSAKSAKRILHAMRMMSIQLGIPMALIAAPASFFVFCIMDNEYALPYGKHSLLHPSFDHSFGTKKHFVISISEYICS